MRISEARAPTTPAATSWKDRLLAGGVAVRLLWLLAPVALWAVAFSRDRYNNYKIFKYVFWHVLEGKNLYLADPANYGDVNHYGPLFALVIAPFAVLPDALGGLLWSVAMAGLFAWAVRRLHLARERWVLLLLLCSLELWDAIWSSQFNPAVAALLLLTFADVEEGRDFIAPLWILIGAFVKIYSVVGLLFFFFARSKKTFVAGCVTWTLVLLALPMAISSPGYILHTYVDWFLVLVEKNAANVVLYTSQDISLMGLVRRATGVPIGSGWFYLVGIPLVLAPLLRFSQYRHRRFRVLILASLLMFVVLFSSGSESATYVICAAGAALWLVEQEEPLRPRNLALMAALTVASLAPTDLLSRPLRVMTNRYAWEALPYVVVWLLLSRDLLARDFAPPGSGAAGALGGSPEAAPRPADLERGAA